MVEDLEPAAIVPDGSGDAFGSRVLAMERRVPLADVVAAQRGVDAPPTHAPLPDEDGDAAAHRARPIRHGVHRSGLVRVGPGIVVGPLIVAAEGPGIVV